MQLLNISFPGMSFFLRVRGLGTLCPCLRHAGGRAIDGTHIPIVCPRESASDYYNRKGYYSIIMQAVVDHKGLFLDAYIGCPGKVHDARVFVNSSLYRKGMNETLLPDWKRQIFGVQVPLVLLGDPAYPALPWLMKPYPENASSTSAIRRYNAGLECQLKMLLADLRGDGDASLIKRMDHQLENVPNVVAACVVLHNMCEMFGDNCREEWVHQEEPSVAQPTSVTSHYSETSATVIRNALKDFVNA